MADTPSEPGHEEGPAPDLPTLTRAQVRELDRYTIQELGLPAVLLMENAGLALAQALQAELQPGDSVCILCGRGNNGGDGYVLARLLCEHGYPVTVLETARPAELSPDAGHFRELSLVPGIAFKPVLDDASLWAALDALAPQSVFIDALLGTGFYGELRENAKNLLLRLQGAVTRWQARVYAVDCPSGFDVDTGRAAAETLRAHMTLTLAAHKPGFSLAGAGEVCGEVRVLPIGIPPAAYAHVQSL